MKSFLVAVGLICGTVALAIPTQAGFLARFKPDEVVVYYDRDTRHPLAGVYVVNYFSIVRSQLFLGSATHCVRTVGHMTGADGKVQLKVDAKSTTGYARYVAIKVGYYEDHDFTRAYRRDHPNERYTKRFMARQVTGKFEASPYFYCGMEESDEANAAARRYSELHAQERTLFGPPPTLDPPKQTRDHLGVAPTIFYPTAPSAPAPARRQGSD